ncbi:MAG: ATPase, T2SS/T4P/T4SS family, partial [Patescibacteria group bacterium]
EEEDAKRRAQRLNLPYLNLISTGAPTEITAMALVPRSEAERALLVPLQITGAGKRLAVAAYDPTTSDTRTVIERLRKEYEVTVYISSLTGLTHSFSYYQYVPEESKEISGVVEINEEHLLALRETVKALDSLHDAIKNFSSPLVSQILEVILAGALALRTSDIHLEPTEDHGVLRLRIDGMLHTVYDALAPSVLKAITTRIKLLSNLKLNIHHEPQDGRFTIGMRDGDIEIRTSVIPSEFGETIVLRLLDPHSISVDLESLGWRPDDLDIVKRTLTRPNGLILNTGPTGSGKTTTLYAFLKYIFKPELKIITIEDPVEYHLKGVSQTQVNEDAGYTFASGLRSVLRQDPNI